MTDDRFFNTAFADVLHALLVHHRLPAWLVGGTVRDALLGRAGGDIDIAVDGDASAFARVLADRTGGSWVPLDDARDTARIVWRDGDHEAGWPRTVDIARLRAPTIEDDLRDRDVTINALALPITSASPDMTGVIDPLNGLTDLHNRRVRLCGPQAFRRDPARMLRAIRLAAQFRFTLDDELDAALREQHGLIVHISPERVRDELLRILAQPDAGRWVRYLDDVGLLTTIIPELEPARTCDQPTVHFFAVLDHLIEAVVCADWIVAHLCEDAGIRLSGTPDQPAAIARNATLSVHLPYASRICERFAERVDGFERVALFKLAVLLHDVAKPQTRAVKPDGGISFYDHQTIGADVAEAIARRLRLSRAACEYVRLVVREHMRPGQLNDLGADLTTRAIYRFFRATGAAGPDVLLHSLCDHVAMKGPLLNRAGWNTHVQWTAQMLEKFYVEQVNLPQPVIRGDDLMRMGVPQGPLIGQLLEDVREAHAVGEITTRDEALAWVRRRTEEETRRG